jgi:hypothetical protein
MPRSTEDIVDEMKMEAENFDRVGIAVVFEGEGDTAKVNLVASNDSDPLSKLNDLLEQGGKPIGLIGIRLNPLRISRRLFTEYEAEQWAHEELEILAEAFGQRALRSIIKPSEN